MRPHSILFAVLSGCALTACQSAAPEPVPPVSLSVDWGSTRACFETASPIFTVGSIPPGTVKLGFRMKDLELPQFNHGGGVVAYSGQTTIPAGAFRYKGPCPQLKAHTYRWTVDAVDAEGNVLAKGQTERSFGQGEAAPAPTEPMAPAAAPD